MMQMPPVPYPAPPVAPVTPMPVTPMTTVVGQPTWVQPPPSIMPAIDISPDKPQVYNNGANGAFLTVGRPYIFNGFTTCLELPPANLNEIYKGRLVHDYATCLYSFHFSEEEVAEYEAAGLCAVLHDSCSNVTLLNDLSYIHDVQDLRIPFPVIGFSSQKGYLNKSGTMIFTCCSNWFHTPNLEIVSKSRTFECRIKDALYSPGSPLNIVSKADITTMGFQLHTHPGTGNEYYQHKITKQCIPIVKRDRVEFLLVKLKPAQAGKSCLTMVTPGLNVLSPASVFIKGHFGTSNVSSIQPVAGEQPVDVNLAHLRLNHLNRRLLKKLPFVVRGLSKLTGTFGQEVCGGCVHGKGHVVSVPRVNTRVRSCIPFHTIHTDVLLFKVRSRHGNHIGSVVFRCEYLNHGWRYCISNISEVLACYERWQNTVVLPLKFDTRRVYAD